MKETYYSRHKEKILERQKKYIENNKEKVLQQKREWQRKHREKLREKGLLPPTKKQLEQENKQLKEIVYNLTTMTVCGDRKQIKNTAQYKLEQLQKVLTELEEWLKQEIENIKTNYSQVNGNYFNMNYKIETYEKALDKIKNLKEK